jgi:hypothetical protein
MAAGDKIFLDTGVALDHLADRQPFAEYAHPHRSEHPQQLHDAADHLTVSFMKIQTTLSDE